MCADIVDAAYRTDSLVMIVRKSFGGASVVDGLAECIDVGEQRAFLYAGEFSDHRFEKRNSARFSFSAQPKLHWLTDPGNWRLSAASALNQYRTVHIFFLAFYR